MGDSPPLHSPTRLGCGQPGDPLTACHDGSRQVTCSVLAEENGDQVRGFTERHPEFAAAPAAELLAPLGERALVFRQAVFLSPEGLQMTPRRTETDGFFVSVLIRSAP